jgi:hypothetical protein
MLDTFEAHSVFLLFPAALLQTEEHGDESYWRHQVDKELALGGIVVTEGY